MLLRIKDDRLDANKKDDDRLVIIFFYCLITRLPMKWTPITLSTIVSAKGIICPISANNSPKLPASPLVLVIA